MQPPQDSGGQDIHPNVSSSEASSSTVISGSSSSSTSSPSEDQNNTNEENGDGEQKDDTSIQEQQVYSPPRTLTGEATAELNDDTRAPGSDGTAIHDESFETAILGEASEHDTTHDDDDRREPNMESKAEETDDIQSVDSNTAVDGRFTQRQQADTDHSVIFGTYDESPVNTSGEVEENDDLLNTSHASLPDYPTDEEENEIIFEEPHSPGGSVYSGLFGLSLWNTRAMSFDSQNVDSKRPVPSPEYQPDRGRFWFWRNRSRSKKKPKPPQTPGVSVDSQLPEIPDPHPIVSPARTVATEGTTSGVDTPMRASRRRRRRRRMFPRLNQEDDSNSDESGEQDQVVEIQSNEADDLELGDVAGSNRSGHSRSGFSHSDRFSRSQRIPYAPSGSDPSGSFHSRSSGSRTLRTGSRRSNTANTRRSERSDHNRSNVSSTANSSPVNLRYSPEPASDAINPRNGASVKGTKFARPNRVVSADDDDDDGLSFRSMEHQRAQYQLITFYRLLWLACIFVCLIISSSVLTAFVGTMLALDEKDDGDHDLPPVNQENEGETTNVTVPPMNPCNSASAWLQLSLKFDSRPEETSIVLQGAGTFRSALWNFPEATFRSFTQFQRTNIFGICISRAARYQLTIADAAADGLVSTLGVAGLTTTIYGNWEITLDGVQRAVYYGNCDLLSSNTTGATASHCGSYCRCNFGISSEEWTGGCDEECD